MTDSDPSSQVSAEFFDRKYRQCRDPWDFSGDPYELARYRALLDHVPAGRFARAYEPGCSVGVLTEELARRCAAVFARDISSAAVEIARERCGHLTGVDIDVGSVVDSPPSADLVVFSEIGYYLTKLQLRLVIDDLMSCLASGGRLVAVHWTGSSADHVLSGQAVHAALRRQLRGWTHVISRQHPDAGHDGFLLDVWDRT